MTYGDDLEDDFVPDDLVVLSGDEEESSEGHEFTPTEEPESTAAQSASAKADKKRKRREHERQKFKERKKQKLAAATNDSEAAEHSSITEQPPHALADYLAAFQSKTFSSVMSPLELEDIRIPVDSIADTTMWTGPRTLDNLVDFIIKVLPNLRLRLSQKSKTNGAPTLLFVSGAALRVVDVTRAKKGAEVAKLFAKHFKLSEHVTYLRRTKIGSAAGTPGRIGKLLCETDALAVNALSHIILDVSFRDSKKRNMLDIPETRDEVFKMVLASRRAKSRLYFSKQ
ncbi:protein cms1 [Favolaschia claudopus]|uniref:Protein cms1 n=1 Tax=Favolaschia claudopus TaxID=2862362 RepID=A0AAW0BDB5_9AGAR